MRQRRLMNQINVVPYIDVMLVLLVIFMVTAPMMNPSKVDLPSVGKSSEIKTPPLQIIVDKKGELTVRDEGGKERKVKWDEVIATIKARQAKNPEQAVVIAADKDVLYEKVVEVMNTLQKNNVQRVGLLVRPGN